MIESTKRKIRERVCRFVRSRYEMIRVQPEQGVFNFRCFENAVEYQRKNPDTEVIEVIYIDEGHPILHYINRKPDGTYLETTLGFRAERLEYYHIRRIHPDDYHRIGAEFDRVLISWTEEFTTWFQRKVLGIERVL